MKVALPRTDEYSSQYNTLLEDDPVVPPPTADELKDLHITLNRTMCYGTCPDYSLDIEADGTVAFDGRYYTATKGTANGKLDQSSLEALVTEIKRSDFFSLNNLYQANVTDLPTYTLTVQMGGQSKQVESYGAGPARLQLLMDRIDEIANSSQWIGNPTQP